MHEIGCRHDDPSADLEQLGCLPQQFRCVSNVLDDVSEKDGCEFALNIAESLGLEIDLLNPRADAPRSLRQSRILLDADDDAVLLLGQVFGKVPRPAPDVQYRFPIVEEFRALQHLRLPLRCVSEVAPCCTGHDFSPILRDSQGIVSMTSRNSNGPEVLGSKPSSQKRVDRKASSGHCHRNGNGVRRLFQCAYRRRACLDNFKEAVRKMRRRTIVEQEVTSSSIRYPFLEVIEQCA
jgi:hypothetical protein